MSGNGVAPDDLIAEKRLWEVFARSLRLPMSRFNGWATALSGVCFSLDAFLSRENYIITAEFVRTFASLGLTVAFSVLAFLVAGFTVFTTMTERSLFMSKAVVRDPQSGLSFLKRDMFLVMRFYGYLIGYIALCAIAIFMSRKGGVAYLVGELFEGDAVRVWLVSIAYVVLSVTTIFIVLQVKSFVFNVYHLVMSSILWGFKKPKNGDGGRQ